MSASSPGRPVSPRESGTWEEPRTIPSKVRKQLGVERGDHLLVEVRDGFVVLIPEVPDPLATLRGVHAELWEGVDAQEYVDKERDAWES